MAHVTRLAPPAMPATGPRVAVTTGPFQPTLTHDSESARRAR